MSEKKVEAYLVKRVKDLGGLCLKFTSPSRAYVPDRVCLLPSGVTWWVEVKQESGRLSGGQHRELERYNLLGHHTAVVYSEEEVDLLVTQMRYSMGPVDMSGVRGYRLGY